MIHLAPMGFRTVKYAETGQIVSSGPFRQPHQTFCGIKLHPEKAAAARCVMDLESPESCRTCVAAMTSRKEDAVQPLNLSW